MKRVLTFIAFMIMVMIMLASCSAADRYRHKRTKTKSDLHRQHVKTTSKHATYAGNRRTN